MHSFIISALLGHSTPTAGFGVGSRITSGYAHATWGAMPCRGRPGSPRIARNRFKTVNIDEGG